MSKLNRSLFWKGIFVFCLSLLGSAIMSTLEILSPGYSVIGALYFVGIVILSAALVQAMWISVEKIIKWSKTPSRKNINLKEIRNFDGSISLSVQNKEWRKSAVIVDEIKGFTKQPIESERWMKLLPIGFQLEKRDKREIRFIVLDDIGNGFFILEHVDGEVKKVHYTVGEYLFCVVLNYRYETGGTGLLKWYDIYISCDKSGKIKVKIEHTKQKD
jgi:hypothetical protein